MEGLEKEITGGWFDVKEHHDNPTKLIELLKLKPEGLEKCVKGLRYSVEEGILEYKRKLISDIFTPLLTLKFDSKGLARLPEAAENGKLLLLVTLCSRALALGTVKTETKVRAPDQAETEEIIEPEKEEPPEPREVMGYVKKRLETNPDLRSHPEVRKILMQMKMYREEITKMQEMKPKIPKEKFPPIAANFQARFLEIREKIGTAYEALLKEDEPKTPEAKKDAPASPLRRYEISRAAPLFLEQAKIFSRTAAILRFSTEERFQTREALVRLSGEEAAHQQLIDRERKEYTRLAPFPAEEIKLSLAFRDGIARVLEREIEWLRR